MKKNFNVCVVWTVSAMVKVEAETLKDAIKQVEEMNGLPPNGKYVDDSFEIDDDATEEANN